MHDGHRLSLKAKGTDLEAAPGQGLRCVKAEEMKCRTPEGDLPPLCPQKGRLETKLQGRWVRCP